MLLLINYLCYFFYSRLFMYYHTLANQTKNRRDIVWVNGTFNYEAQRSWFWFPLFSFFESDIDCKIPNEFQWPMTLQVKKKLNSTKQSPLANTDFFIYLKKIFSGCKEYVWLLFITTAENEQGKSAQIQFR